jgi:hypothetical protein
MDTTRTTERHPLHALYLGQRHGEVATLDQRAQLARARATAGIGRAAPEPAVVFAGLGLAAAAAAHLVAKLIRGL